MKQRARMSIEEGVVTANPDPHHGEGGSYVNNEDGTRSLVERTKQVSIRDVEAANPQKKDEGGAVGAVAE